MTQTSREYGEALFSLAKETGKENEYAVSLECILEVIGDNPEYIVFLSSPSISLEERLDAIDKAFGSSIPEDIVSFVKLLCEKGRIHLIKEAIEVYKNLLDAQNMVSTAFVKSAAELNEDEKEKLKDKLEIKVGHSVVLECCLDESLIGGMVIEIDGKVIDASIKSRLSEVKDVISK